jgi:IclR family transcriptional regulator, KDG regulon repressor
MKFKPRKLDGEVYSVKAIDRAIQVLNCFSSDPGQFTLGELAALTGLPKPTLFRILQTLEKNRFVSYDAGTSKYCLGMRLFELGGAAFSSMSLRQTASKFVDVLVMHTRCPAMVGILAEGELVYIDGRPGSGHVQLFGAQIGKRYPPYYGAVGKALMAHLSNDEVDALLSRYPLQQIAPRSITDHIGFKRSLQEIRDKGYAYEEGELVEGVIGIAAPVRNHLGRVVAAVGMVFPAFRADDKKRERMTGLVTETAMKISQAMGFMGIMSDGHP